MKYTYIVIKFNNSYFSQESVLFKNDYKAKKYAYFEMLSHKDGSESIANIFYSNDIAQLQAKAEGFISWYNYPLNLCKDMKQHIMHIENKSNTFALKPGLP